MQGASYLGGHKDENQAKNIEDLEIDNSKSVHHH